MFNFYSRSECPLCDEFEHELVKLAGELSFDWVKKDVDDDPELQARYGYDVPVFCQNDTVICQHYFDKDSILEALSLYAKEHS